MLTNKNDYLLISLNPYYSPTREHLNGVLKFRLSFDHFHIFGQCFKAQTTYLHNRNRDVPCLAGVDISNKTGFPFMRTRNHFAGITIF
jgi:hypothetical protein